jgi:hypothetical protein
MLEQLSVFDDPDAGFMKRVDARENLRRLFMRRWCGIWDNRPFPGRKYAPREETVKPNPRFL